MALGKADHGRNPRGFHPVEGGGGASNKKKGDEKVRIRKNKKKKIKPGKTRTCFLETGGVAMVKEGDHPRGSKTYPGKGV